MSQVKGYTGNAAAAVAFRQIHPDVVAAYPITPSTEVVELFSQYVADGRVQTEFVPVESEHSAMSACIGASAGGARVMTATSSQGLMLMSELLYVASGLRLPIVMALANRALSAPLNIHGDHSDAMAARDSGWIQLFCENAQEVYDTLIQAVCISEETNIRLPVMVCYDGFTLSHTLERVTVLEDSEVQSFIGKSIPRFPLLDMSKAVTYGAVDLPDYYTEHRRQIVESMEWAEKRTIPEIGKEFYKQFGREYGLIETYFTEDADVVLVLMGSAAGAAKEAVDILRRHNLRAGVLRIRSFRPFPQDAVMNALQNADMVAVMDRTPAFGSAAPLFSNVQNSLYGLDFKPRCFSFIGGLGGRDLPVETFRRILMKAEKMVGQDLPLQRCTYFDVREDSIILKNSQSVS